MKQISKSIRIRRFPKPFNSNNGDLYMRAARNVVTFVSPTRMKWMCLPAEEEIKRETTRLSRNTGIHEGRRKRGNTRFKTATSVLRVFGEEVFPFCVTSTVL